jgi:hypothetical protein
VADELGAIDAGTVEVGLVGAFERKGFDQYDQAILNAEKKKAVQTKLGADFDPDGFDKYDRALAVARAKAKRKDAYKAELGADFDPKVA